MSADPERLFSGAKITISDRRNRLGIATIQALECLKSWLKVIEIQGKEIEDEDDDIDTGRATAALIKGVEVDFIGHIVILAIYWVDNMI